MHRTTLYLDDDLHRRLQQAAEARGVTQALVIREAVAKYVAPAKRRPKSIGLGRSSKKLKGKLSARAEQLLEGFGEDR